MESSRRMCGPVGAPSWFRPWLQPEAWSFMSSSRKASVVQFLLLFYWFFLFWSFIVYSFLPCSVAPALPLLLCTSRGLARIQMYHVYACR